MSTIPCPNCGEASDAGKANQWRPFCCRRCKMIDLGDWLAEEHRIPGKPAANDWSAGKPPGYSEH